MGSGLGFDCRWRSIADHRHGNSMATERLMGILERLFSKTEKRALSLTDYKSWVEAGIVGPSAAGIPVTPGRALKYSVVYACVRILAETLASLPLFLYERQDRGKRKASEYYLFDILHNQPNEFMTSYEYFLTLQSHLALWGNAYSEIEYDQRGRVMALWPLRPDRMVEVTRNGQGRLYRYMLPTGQITDLSGDRVWHVRAMGLDGWNGYNQVDLMRQPIGLGMAAEEFGARFFGNDARPGVVLRHPGILGEEASKNLRDSWQSQYGGLSKSHRIGILEEGMELQEIGIPPEAAQFLETRNFQVRDIARFYRIPLHMIGDLERATFSNIEHQSIEFVVYTMRPWLVNWEKSISSNLMLNRERERYFPKFIVEGLLRGDTQSRYEAYNKAWMIGWLSQNEIRELEDLNPIDGGDEYYVPLNMIPASQAGSFGMGSSEDEDTGTRERGNAETRQFRQARSVATRHRLKLAYQPLLADAAGRVFRREANDVSNAWKKFTRKRQQEDFISWVVDFYLEHQTFAAQQMYPSMNAYSELVSAEAWEEVQTEPDDEAIGRFTNRYTTAWAARNATRSQNDIMAALEEEDPDAALDDVFGGWRNERPEQTGFEEAVRLGAAIALTVFVAAGVTAKRWRTHGDNCPYCNDLGGRSIGVAESFIPSGFSFSPEGVEIPLVPSTNIGHPPAHRGCDCSVEAGL